MKIKGIDKRNGREFLADQVIEAGGVSPWDGQPFAPDYAVVLVNALRDAVEAGDVLEEALVRWRTCTPTSPWTTSRSSGRSRPRSTAS